MILFGPPILRNPTQSGVSLFLSKLFDRNGQSPELRDPQIPAPNQ